MQDAAYISAFSLFLVEWGEIKKFCPFGLTDSNLVCYEWISLSKVLVFPALMKACQMFKMGPNGNLRWNQKWILPSIGGTNPIFVVFWWMLLMTKFLAILLKKKKGQSSISESIQHLGHPGDRKKPQEVRKIVPPGSWAWCKDSWFKTIFSYFVHQAGILPDANNLLSVS